MHSGQLAGFYITATHFIRKTDAQGTVQRL